MRLLRAGCYARPFSAIRWATLGTRLVLFFDGSTASRPFNLARSGRPPLACTTTTPDRHRTVILSMQTSPTPEASASPPRPPGHVPPARLAVRSRDSQNRPTPHSPTPLASYRSLSLYQCLVSSIVVIITAAPCLFCAPIPYYSLPPLILITLTLRLRPRALRLLSYLTFLLPRHRDLS